MSKRCFKCCKTKDLDDFYVHKAMADGYLGKCKACTKKDVTAHRNKNLARIREYDKRRAKLPHRKKQLQERVRRFRKESPLAYAAHTILSNAVRAGKIKKPKRCQICKRKRKLHGHHPDYYKPLEVIWACPPCHFKIG